MARKKTLQEQLSKFSDEELMSEIRRRLAEYMDDETIDIDFEAETYDDLYDDCDEDY